MTLLYTFQKSAFISMRLKLESSFFFLLSIPLDDIEKQYSAYYLSSLDYLSYRRNEMQANKKSEKGRKIGMAYMIK